jgi:hypothetical protein
VESGLPASRGSLEEAGLLFWTDHRFDARIHALYDTLPTESASGLDACMTDGYSFRRYTTGRYPQDKAPAADLARHSRKR